MKNNSSRSFPCNCPRSYIFTDVNPLYKLTYYRLKIVNTNASLDYTSVVSVPSIYDFNLAVYPNPFEGSTHVQITGLNNENVKEWTYRVFDMQVRVVDAGKSDVTSQNVGSNLCSGVYVIEVVYGPLVLKEKTVKY